MIDQTAKANIFRALHIKGEPVVLYNVWDAGSAQAVRDMGAKAIASGSHGVANAMGYEDGEQIPFELALENSRRIVAVSEDLPVSMDLETGYGTTPAEVGATAAKAIATGIVGVNLEDQDFATDELRPVEGHAERLKAIRTAADEAGVPLFINARSDLFKNAPAEDHTDELLAQAIERANAYAEAGADSFFLPGITDIDLIRQLCEASPIGVNIIKIPGTPSQRGLAEAGVARISYGPVPYLQMIEWLKGNAKSALALED